MPSMAGGSAPLACCALVKRELSIRLVFLKALLPVLWMSSAEVESHFHRLGGANWTNALHSLFWNNCSFTFMTFGFLLSWLEFSSSWFVLFYVFLYCDIIIFIDFRNSYEGFQLLCFSIFFFLGLYVIEYMDSFSFVFSSTVFMESSFPRSTNNYLYLF